MKQIVPPIAACVRHVDAVVEEMAATVTRVNHRLSALWECSYKMRLLVARTLSTQAAASVARGRETLGTGEKRHS